MGRSPSALSLEWCEAKGLIAGNVQRSSPHRRLGAFNRDLYGFFDIIAFSPNDALVYAIQTTSRSHVREHMAKGQGIPAVLDWIRAKHIRILEVHGWYRKTVLYRDKRGRERKKKEPALDRWIAMSDGWATKRVYWARILPSEVWDKGNYRVRF